MYLRMQATNRSAVSYRSRNRLIGCVMAIVLALSALAFASTASAAPPEPNYLALGDSLAFGYSQQLFNENEILGEPPTAFENGYVNVYFAAMTGSSKTLFNDSCVGETTDSMIGNGSLGFEMKDRLGTTVARPCLYHYAAGHPLHNEYGGTKSQLENALETIAAGAAMGNPIRTVTLDIGPNDEIHFADVCKKTVEQEFHSPSHTSQYGTTEKEAVRGCFLVQSQQLVRNLVGIVDVIRFGGGWGGVNFTGKIVVLGVYNPYGAVNTPGKELVPGSNAAQTQLNSEEAKLVTEPEPGACYANSLPLFNPQNNDEPIRLQTLTEMGNHTTFEGKKNGPDIHATPVGYHELAYIMLAQCG
jgi:hypothetical protein